MKGKYCTSVSNKQIGNDIEWCILATIKSNSKFYTALSLGYVLTATAYLIKY